MFTAHNTDRISKLSPFSSNVYNFDTQNIIRISKAQTAAVRRK